MKPNWPKLATLVQKILTVICFQFCAAAALKCRSFPNLLFRFWGKCRKELRRPVS